MLNLKNAINYVHGLGEKKSVLTETELIQAGIGESILNELVDLEVLYPSASGIYMPDNADFGERHSEVEVTTRFPETVICLSNALNFHNLTTQRSDGVWIAYKDTLSEPVEPKLPIKTVPMSEPGFSRGIEVHQIDGLSVKIYNVPKTVADCFIYEDIVGADVSKEAFIQSVRENRCTVSDILNYLQGYPLNLYTKNNLDRCIKKTSKITR